MIQLASLFSDGAVLQREMPIPVWGKTAPGVLVHVTCGTAEGYGKSSAAGKFMVYLPPLPAGGPLTLTVSTPDESLTLHQILVGEVWLAGGQSNMEYRLNSDLAVVRPEPGVELLSRRQEKEFLATIRDPDMVRSIRIPEITSGAPEETFSGTWRKMTKENAPEFSAIGAWFARTLQETLHVPVGLIECNWGGTIVETWSSRSALMRHPETAALVREADDRLRAKEMWNANSPPIDLLLEKCRLKDTGNQGFAKGWAEPDLNDELWKEMHVPGSWIQQKVAGNGVIWARIAVTIPEKWVNKPLHLHLSSVDKQDITYFNGKEVGRTGKDFETAYWSAARNYSIPPESVKAGRAVIAIRAYSFMYDGAIGGGFLKNPETGETISLNGTWKALAETDYGSFCPNDAPEIRFHHANPNLPSALFNSMLRPLIPYAMRGVIWYQGESNAGRKHDAMTYDRKLRAMIEDWRYQWAQGDFPFIQMILAGYRMPKTFSTDDIWPTLREAQIRLCREMPEVYAASAIDLGDVRDIHPQNKKDAGLRMSRIALSKVYRRQEVISGGPRLQKWAVEGNKLRLIFENGGGLAFRGGEVKGFVLLDANGQQLPASFTLQDETLILRWQEGIFPRELYYCWADNPDGTLENEAALPADPFHIFV